MNSGIALLEHVNLNITNRRDAVRVYVDILEGVISPNSKVSVPNM